MDPTTPLPWLVPELRAFFVATEAALLERAAAIRPRGWPRARLSPPFSRYDMVLVHGVDLGAALPHGLYVVPDTGLVFEAYTQKALGIRVAELDARATLVACLTALGDVLLELHRFDDGL